MCRLLRLLNSEKPSSENEINLQSNKREKNHLLPLTISLKHLIYRYDLDVLRPSVDAVVLNDTVFVHNRLRLR